MADSINPSDILKHQRQEKRALRMLLDDQVGRRDSLLVQKMRMGGTDSYVGSVTLEWFAARVGFAAMLPLFRRHVDPKTFAVRLDKETMEQVQQRALNWARQAHLAKYLAGQPHHKFPPVLAVVSRGWVDNPSADEWAADTRALKSSVHYTPLTTNGQVGLIDTSDDVQLYALDGQHRLMGVIGLMKLIREGMLPVYDKDHKQLSTLTLEDIERDYETDKRGINLAALAEERIGIEFIAGVMRGETREMAKRRVRSIFVHVNKYARQLTKGETAQLDENDGYALVARWAATHHSLFETKDGTELVDFKNPNLPAGSTHLTTLQTLVDMARGYLGFQFEEASRLSWRTKHDAHTVPVRPPDYQVEDAKQLFGKFLDKLKGLNAFKSVVGGRPIAELREFRASKRVTGEGNLLMRPIGQVVIAAAIGQVAQKHSDIGPIFAKLSALEEAGGFALERTDNPWYLLLYNPVKGSMRPAGKKIATDVLVYMLLGNLPAELESRLRKRFATARTSADSGKAMNLKGRWVLPANITLPSKL